MTDSRAVRPAALPWAGVAILAAVLACAGYWLLFTTFMVYDDEGYVLISLRHFSAHGALYDQVYSQYGPVPYLWYDLLHRIFNFDFTNTSGRWITLLNWAAVCGACTALVARLTRSAGWSALTLAGVFTHLWVMIDEPIHPGGLAAVGLALGTWLAAECWQSGRRGGFAVVAGVTSAVLALIKINVGVFFFAAAVTWLAVHTAPHARSRRLAWLIAVGCALLPFGLMHALMGQPWVRLYALVFTAAALSLLLVLRHSAPPVVGRRSWWQFLGAFALTGIALCGAALLHGSSLRGLLNGVLLQPLRHPGVYYFAMNWRLGTGVLAIAGLGAAAYLAHRGAWQRPGVRVGLAWLRVAALAGFLCAPFGLINASSAAWTMCYGLSLAWVCAVPLRSERDTSTSALWLALVLVFGSLHAFPVAGSQINWGTFLWVPLLALGLHDAAPILGQHLGRHRSWARWLMIIVVGGSVIKMAGELAVRGAERYYQSQRLGVKGAENVRLPDDITSAIRVLDENLRAHADLLFSFPGVFSTNLWTGLPTPTLANTTHWFSLLSAVEQDAIIARLADRPRAALVVQHDVVGYLLEYGFSPQSRLYSWLAANFEPQMRVDGYEIWLKRGRKIAALSTARIVRSESPSQRMMHLTLRAPAEPVDRIEICVSNQPRRPLFTINRENAKIRIQPIALDNSPTGEQAELEFPLRFSGLATLSIEWAAPPSVPLRPGILLVLRGSSGQWLAEARVINSRPMSP